jgi:hypothetical protein
VFIFFCVILVSVEKLKCLLKKSRAITNGINKRTVLRQINKWNNIRWKLEKIIINICLLFISIIILIRVFFLNMNEQAKPIPIPTQAGSSKNAHMTTCRNKVILSLNKIRFFK